MRRVATLSLLLLASMPLWHACGGAQSSFGAGPYTVERDVIEGLTRATLRDVRAMAPDGSVVGFDLTAWEGNPDVRVRTTTVSSDWQHRDCKRLSFVADGQTLPARNVRHTGERVDGQVLEHLEGDVVGWSFRKVAKADRVEARLCEEVVRFERPERNALGRLVRVAWEGAEPTRPGWLEPGEEDPRFDELRF